MSAKRFKAKLEADAAALFVEVPFDVKKAVREVQSSP
jgi:hypothetical protein